MSKTGKSNYINYNPSAGISINGQNKSGVNISPWGTTGYYNMSDDEQQAYDYAQKQFANNLSKINIFDNDVKQGMNNQVQAFVDAGIDDINDIYKPMLQELQNDIASRFGNLDNSVFMDNLNKIEDKRADAVSDLARNTEIYRNDLVNNELSNRYQYLDYLNNYQQQALNNALSALGASQNLSGLSNSYYNSLNGIIRSYNNQKDDSFSFNNILNNVMGSLGSGISMML